MKATILDIKKGMKGERTLPRQFQEPVRTDLIARAVHALQAAARQPYGADPEAGKRASAELSRRRRAYRGSYGQGISRVPRKILTRRGTRIYYVGAFAPGTVGGRRAHPPKAEKVWEQKLNKRENRKAIRSALAAVMDKAIVEARGHKVPAEYPFLIENTFESLAKTAQVESALVSLGFADDLKRAATTKVRAGRAKLRGRKTKRATSLLIVTSKQDVALATSAVNIPGVETCSIDALNAALLAPGTHPGRATLFTEAAIARLEKEGLFLDRRPAVKAKAAMADAEKKPVQKPAQKPVKTKAQKPAAKPVAKKAPAKKSDA